MKRDLTGARTWGDVSEFFRRLYEPGFGQPVDLSELDVRPGSRDIVATALVFDAAEGAGRRAVVTVREGRLAPVSAGTGDCFSPRWSADGECLAFLSDRQERWVNRLQLLARSAVGEAAEISVPGTVEQLAWSPGGHQLLLRVAGLDEDKPEPAVPARRASGMPRRPGCRG